MKQQKKSERAKESIIKRINDWFHLWVGIATGIPILLISLTGCLLVFEQEITEWSRPWWRIENLGAEHLLPPSQIRQRVQHQLPHVEFRKFWYYGDDAPVKITPENSDSLIFVNPYNGQVLAMVDHENLFHFIEEGHVSLWLPHDIGHQVVSWSTVIFTFLLITGLVLWWPKKWNKRHTKQAFAINWKAKWKRINYDLHNVLGFYSLLLALLMAFTGLIMGFLVVRQSVVYLSGGIAKNSVHDVMQQWNHQLPTVLDDKMDAIWYHVTREIAERNPLALSIHYPKDDDQEIYVCTDMEGGTWRYLYFDRNTLDLTSSSQKRMRDAVPAEWISRATYGLHTGFIGGTSTKIFYFIASLICASLPVTGFYVWWGKRKKTKQA
ncbi:PepSY domain-containing protein [Sphingobacterium sp. SGG-5]|uniref:PepSY-associated TM helix domain-containing protein n=1 Tax=Sphingobacterium sp. SGG-5 TaxID=2710881 RepID=UPI0013EBEF02|nr:PepSY-associated TM helix domain-containing protein [Sphingobacterium sp. SGG-5]NGM63358.1 PepSY domain-containing protein [Sphingobacterium sp. SGG-5]